MIKNILFSTAQVVTLATGQNYTLKEDEVLINGTPYKKLDCEIQLNGNSANSDANDVRVGIRRKNGGTSLPATLTKFSEWEVDGVTQTTLALCVENITTALFVDIGIGGGVQDNIIKHVVLRTVGGSLNLAQMASAINALSAFTIAEDEIYYFRNNVVIPANPPIRQSRYTDIYVLRNLGKGDYGVGGTNLTSATLRNLGSTNTSIADIENLASTQFINLGDVGDTDITTAFNAYTFTGAEDPIQSQNDGYVLINVTINSEALQYLFVGDGGAYGTGGTETAIDEDFVLLTDILQLASTQFIDIFDIGSQTIEDGFNAHTFTGAEDPIQDQVNGYVVVDSIMEGTPTQHLFVGAGGAYGTGGTETAIANDFLSFTAVIQTPLSDIWRDHAGTSPASSYTQSIRHDGQVSLNKKLWVGGGSTYGIQNQTTSWLYVRGNQGVYVMAHNPNVGHVILTANGQFTVSFTTGSTKYGVRVGRLFNDTEVNNDFTTVGQEINDTVDFTQKTGDSKYVALRINPTIQDGSINQHYAVESLHGKIVVTTHHIEALGYTISDIDAIGVKAIPTVEWINTNTGGERKRAVIDIVDNTVAPPTEVSGDRYILDFTGGGVHADWDGALAGDIVEYNGTTWDSESPNEGWVTYVDTLDVDYLYVDDGTPAWEARTFSTPSLQAVTDIGNTTTLNIGALTFNDLELFAQIGVDVDNIGIGLNALLANTGLNMVAIGTDAGRNNNVSSCVFIGKISGRNNTGATSTFIGDGSGDNNSGATSTGVGKDSLNNNTGVNCVGIGVLSLSFNSGSSAVGIGNNALERNTASQVTGVGEAIFQDNTAIQATGLGWQVGKKNIGLGVVLIGNGTAVDNIGQNTIIIGNLAGSKNIGNQSIGIGDKTLQYNQSINNVAIGYNANIDFKDDTANDKTFAFGDINAGTDRITITSHGFGANSTWINLRYTEGTSPVTGLTSNIIYQVFIVDANTLSFLETISGSITHGKDITAEGTGTGHTLTPQFIYSNTTVLGANTEPTKSNQVVLGDTSVTEVYTDGHIKTHKEITDDTTTAYELVLSDRFSFVTMDNASSNTLTIPANSATAFPIGTEIKLFNKGAGVTTVAITTDTLTQNVGGLTMAQDTVRTLYKIGATLWMMGE